MSRPSRKHSFWSALISASWRTRSCASVDVARRRTRRLRLLGLRAREPAHAQDALEDRLVDRRLGAVERDQLADVHALVAHPLDVLDDVQQRGDEAQVGGHRRLEREQRQDPLVDLEVAAVDAVVVGDHHRRELGVARLDHLERAVDRLEDEVEPAERRDLELLELLLEVPPRVVGTHQPTLPVT